MRLPDAELAGQNPSESLPQSPNVHTEHHPATELRRGEGLRDWEAVARVSTGSRRLPVGGFLPEASPSAQVWLALTPPAPACRLPRETMLAPCTPELSATQTVPNLLCFLFFFHL